MNVDLTLQKIGVYEALSSGSDVRDFYLELRGALAQENIILPSYFDLQTQGVTVNISDDELQGLLKDSPTDVKRVAQSDDAVQGQAVEVIAFAAVVIGLAVLCKISYSRKNGLVIDKGFPDLADVLGKLKFPSAAGLLQD